MSGEKGRCNLTVSPLLSRNQTAHKRRVFGFPPVCLPHQVRQVGHKFRKKWAGGAGQGNRVKESWGDKACEEFIVPGSYLAPQTHGVFGRGPSHEVVRDVLDDSEIGGGVVSPHAAFVVAEDHV